MQTGFVHPETVGDNQLWIGSDILRKIQFGDPTKGWEGDEYLAVFWNPLYDSFELCRWENGDYSVVARQRPGVFFDERIIDELVRRDMKRNPKRDIAADIESHNEKIRNGHRKNFDEMLNEEVSPRIRRSFQREGWI